MKFRKNTEMYVYLLLPLLLWPLTFIVFSKYFIYAMALSELLLISFSLLRFRKYVPFRKSTWKKTAIAGTLGAAVLYAIFLIGYHLALFTGNGAYVTDIYRMIYAESGKMVIFILLAFIGIAEEIYWRGGIQGIAEKNTRMFRSRPWIASTAYYACIHLTTLNPILALAAFFVGLVNSLIAQKYGIVASAISHIAWIEAIILFLPVISI